MTKQPQTTCPDCGKRLGDGIHTCSPQKPETETTPSPKQNRLLLAARKAIEERPHLTDRDLAMISSINKQLGVKQ